MPPLSFNTTVAPLTPVPDTLVSPAFGAVIVGFALSCCAFATVFVASSDGCFPSSCWIAFIVSPSPILTSSGTVTSHVPSSFIVASPMISSPFVTVNVAPLTPPVPVIFVAPAFVSSITGVALFSAGAFLLLLL